MTQTIDTDVPAPSRYEVRLPIRHPEILLVLGAAMLSVIKLQRGLWIDETVTYWVVKDGLREAMARTFNFPPLSPLYTPLAWASVALGGASEIALRLPSVAAMAGAVYFMYRIGCVLLDETAAISAAVLLAYVPGVSLGTLARPYALAFLTMLAATWSLLGWLERPSRGHAAAYVLLSAATIYFQPLYAPVLGIHLVLAWERRRAAVPRLLAIDLCVGLLILPLAWRMWTFHGRAMASSFARVPEWSEVLSSIAWLVGATALLLLLRRRLPFRIPAATLVMWAIGPFILIWALARATGLGIVVFRYYAYFFPGAILVLAALLRVARAPLRLIALVGILFVFVPESVFGYYENWREGVARIHALRLPADTPVLLRSGLPEARIWYASPDRIPYLMAPLTFYPVAGPAITLPYDLDETGTSYLEKSVIPMLQDHRYVVILAHVYEYTALKEVPFRAWFDEHLPRFRSTEVWRQGPLLLLLYTRRDVATGPEARGTP